MRGGALARVGAGGDEVAGRARPGGFEVVGPGGAGMGWGGGPDGARRRAGQTGPRGGQIGRGGGGPGRNCLYSPKGHTCMQSKERAGDGYCSSQFSL